MLKLMYAVLLKRVQAVVLTLPARIWQMFEAGTPCRHVFLMVEGSATLSYKNKDLVLIDGGGWGWVPYTSSV